MPDEKGTTDDKGKGDVKDENFIGTFKDKEAAEQGWANLETKLNEQGTELGGLRKQVEFAHQVIDDMKAKPAPAVKPEVPTYDKEIATVQKEMAELDLEDRDYNENLLAGMNKLNALSRKAQHEETMVAATSAFKKELDDRDVKSTHNAFYRDNPDFNTPEMQMQIKERLANDQTGMSDDLVAYREIQRDAATEKATQLEEENAELKRLANVSEGTNKTGKVVVTDGQAAAPKSQTKLTGADLDKAMLDALHDVK